jgi:hypothetical protein
MHVRFGATAWLKSVQEAQPSRQPAWLTTLCRSAKVCDAQSCRGEGVD